MLYAGVDQDDIQGLLRSGYGSLTEAGFLLLRVADQARARTWLGSVKIPSCADLEAKVDSAVHVGLTSPGLRALGLTGSIIDMFPEDFVYGMAADEARSRRLGDTGPNAPAKWQWGYGEREPHAIVMLYAKDGCLKELRASVTASFEGAFEILTELATANLHSHEPFGFRDGISQPKLDWPGKRNVGSGTEMEYSNEVALGEFVLGYRNEYGRYAGRPVLEPTEPRAALLPEAADEPGKRDIGRNGSYLVVRQLHQHLRDFWHFAAKGRDLAQAVALAEAMVGRRMEGEPLVPLSNQAIPGIGPDAEEKRLNGFTFAADVSGFACPHGAHVRRSNPRSADIPGGRQGLIALLLRQLGFLGKGPEEDLVSPTRFHRILRRGREYGKTLSPAAAADPNAPDLDSGINFICLNANISRQFEFIQNAWAMNSKFNGMTGESDPIIGNREPLANGERTDTFRQPQKSGLPRVTKDLPQFITVKGGAYFFLPGLRALRFIAGAGKDA